MRVRAHTNTHTHTHTHTHFGLLHQQPGLGGDSASDAERAGAKPQAHAHANGLLDTGMRLSGVQSYSLRRLHPFAGLSRAVTVAV